MEYTLSEAAKFGATDINRMSITLGGCRFNSKRVRRLAKATVLAWIAMVFGLIGCKQSSGNGTPRTELIADVYHRGNSSEPATLDPQKLQSVDDANIVTDLFVGLMTIGPDARPILGAAESYSVSGDGLTYRFVLRRGHVWSDGTAVTAMDFVYGFRRLLNPSTAAIFAALFADIKNAQAVNSGSSPVEALGVTAPDARTVEIRLNSRVPYLFDLLTMPPAYPVPTHVVERFGDEWVRVGNMVSNGAYILKERRPNGFVRIEKNPLFYDERNVRIKKVLYYPTIDRNAALVRFRGGELDSNNDIPTDRIDSLRLQIPDQVRVSPRLQTVYVGFNTQSRTFADARVRQALTMIIDRKRLADDVMRRLFLPAVTFVPPGIDNYSGALLPEWTRWTAAERLNRARDLLRAAGYSANRPLRFTYRIWGSADTHRRAVALAAMWREAGVDVRILETEPTTHDAAVRAGDFEAAELAWTADYNDPLSFLFLLDSGTGPLNATRYVSKAYDALLAKARADRDIRTRAAVLAQAENLALEEAPVAPILTGTTRTLIAPYLNGLQPNPVGRYATRFLWIDPARRAKATTH